MGLKGDREGREEREGGKKREKWNNNIKKLNQGGLKTKELMTLVMRLPLQENCVSYSVKSHFIIPFLFLLLRLRVLRGLRGHSIG
jgi:hypothetical protein